MDFKRKESKDFFTKELLFKTVGVVFLVGIVILISADINIYKKKNKLEAQLETYKKQIEEIKKSSQTLKEEIANADNPDYLEKLGYEQFNKTKPGETEYMFIKPTTKTELESKPEDVLNTKLWYGWLSNIVQWIKSKF